MPRGGSGVAARGPLVGVLRSAAHRRAESRFWGVFIIAVHRTPCLCVLWVWLWGPGIAVVWSCQRIDVCDSVRLLYLLMTNHLAGGPPAKLSWG